MLERVNGESVIKTHLFVERCELMHHHFVATPTVPTVKRHAQKGKVIISYSGDSKSSPDTTGRTAGCSRGQQWRSGQSAERLSCFPHRPFPPTPQQALSALGSAGEVVNGRRGVPPPDGLTSQCLTNLVFVGSRHIGLSLA